MQLKKIIAIGLAIGLLMAKEGFASATNWQKNSASKSEARLISSFYEDEKGEKKLIAALHFKLASGWKIYGQDAGGIGLPPSVDFSGSKAYSSHEFFWPKAKRAEEKLGNDTIKYSYYEDEVVLPIALKLQKNDEAVELTAKVEYGVCKNVCVPVSENFSLKVSDEIDEKVLQEIQKFLPEKNLIAKPQKATPQEVKISKGNRLISALFAALIGGAILNIMPCVFPVLSIKLMSVINHANAEISRIRFAFFSTILGILLCFVFFWAMAAAIKLTGNSLDWGLQFQNPYFLIFLTVILVLFAGNLLGIFEVSFAQFLANFLNKKISNSEKKKNIFLPNFLSGILAVLLATPCSAPILGSAISFALTQDFLTILLIFFVIGIGFASPYFVLIFSPKLVYLLPKPGPWMEHAKQAIAGLLFATVIWLIYILSHNIGTIPAFLVGALSISLLGCLKIKLTTLRYVALIAVATAAFTLPIDLGQKQFVEKQRTDMMWKNFDEAEIYRQIENGKVVIIDVTADWCITCKFNKIRVLRDSEVVYKLNETYVYAMRGDITKPNEEVMNFLHKHNRFAIPFNIVYGPSAKSGILLNELLSKEELLSAIEKAR